MSRLHTAPFTWTDSDRAAAEMAEMYRTGFVTLAHAVAMFDARPSPTYTGEPDVYGMGPARYIWERRRIHWDGHNCRYTRVSGDAYAPNHIILKGREFHDMVIAGGERLCQQCLQHFNNA